MDRDGRWDRTQRAFDAIVHGTGEHADDPVEAVRRSYEREVTDRFVQELDRNGYGFAVLNFANPDMVGHTGSIPATVKAVEAVDGCLGEVVAAVEAKGGVALITADHGNAEQMFEADGVSPRTAHTTNPVPLIVTDPEATLGDGGELSELVPTVLGFLGFKQPLQMTGKSLTTPG